MFHDRGVPVRLGEGRGSGFYPRATQPTLSWILLTTPGKPVFSRVEPLGIRRMGPVGA